MASTVALAGGVQPGQSPQDSPEHEYSAAHQCSQADSKRAAAARELEDPRGASPSLACPPARPRSQARKASFLASMPSAHMPKDTSQRA